MTPLNNSQEVERFSYKMQEKIENNLVNTVDPIAIGYSCNHTFNLVFQSIKRKMEAREDLSLNAILFRAFLESHVGESMRWEFLRYIHIFNYAETHNFSAIDLGVDFHDFNNDPCIFNDYDCSHKKYGNSLFRKNSLAVMGRYGYNILEYYANPDTPILDPRITPSIKWHDGEYHLCPFFQELIYDLEDWSFRNISFYESWLRDFDRNNQSCNGTNHFFFIEANSEQNIFDPDHHWYTLHANIGIDSSKTNVECIQMFLNKFMLFLDKLTNLVFSFRARRNKYEEACFKAISQVMTRNMSHNISSHVLSHLTVPDVYHKLSDDEISKELGQYLSDDSVFQSEKNLQLPCFFQYQKNRMDYLSEVTFGIPGMLTTKYIHGDVFRELDRVRLLLNYISGISDFKYTFHLKLNGEWLTGENDIAVAFPSDILGCQAFYNIIENIIRNTAKHAYNHSRDVNVFTIEFIDVEDFPEYYCVEIDNGIAEDGIEELVEKQNERINTSILDSNNKLRDHSLGLLEMEASAAFLRQVDIAKVDSDDYHFANRDKYKNNKNNLILLKAINKNGALGYRFFMQKPKEFLLVGDFGVGAAVRNAGAGNGVLFLEENTFANAMNDGRAFAHPFLLYPDNVSLETKEMLSSESNCKTLLTARKIELSSDEVRDVARILSDENHENILERLKDFAWEKYFKRIIAPGLKNPGNESIKIRPAFNGMGSLISNQVVFLNHGYKSTHSKQWEQICNADGFEAWIENLSSRASSKLPQFGKYSVGDVNPVSDYLENIRNKDSIKYDIFEAYHNKVVVLDERIQRFARENFEGSSKDSEGPIPCGALFKSTNVLIPEEPVDPIAFDEESIAGIERFIDENAGDAFLLIHYGILERMYKKEAVITDKLNKWAKASRRVVVTSGRGAHSLPLPPSVCFANLSSVLYAFTENRNKYIINSLLNQAQRKKE